MTEPLISVVLPVHNREKYLIQAIESVIHQKYSNFELIISDDCSKKETLDILREYENHPKVNVYYNMTNLGLFSNLNHAISKASGEFITIICSDDIFLPDCISSNYELISNQLHTPLLLPSSKNIDSDGADQPSSSDYYYNLFCPGTKLFTSLEMLPLLLQYGSVNGNITGMLFKKKIHEGIGGFREDWQHAGDWEWIYRIARNHPVLISREVTVKVRVHQEQLSVTNGRNLSAIIEAGEMVKLLLADSNIKRSNSASRWAGHTMHGCLWYGIKLFASLKFLQAFTVMRAIHESAGFKSTFLALIKTFPQRWNTYKGKGFIIPPP
jgi:glycosyltransferase involved in cell wall biosynthesis